MNFDVSPNVVGSRGWKVVQATNNVVWSRGWSVVHATKNVVDGGVIGSVGNK